jgi:hypothetical protein
MNYTINEDRLYKVFSRFLKENMGKLYYDEPDNEFYHFVNGMQKSFGYLGWNSEPDTPFHFYFYWQTGNNLVSELPRTISSLFGDNYRDLLLRYLNEHFPSFPITEID